VEVWCLVFIGLGRTSACIWAQQRGMDDVKNMPLFAHAECGKAGSYGRTGVGTRPAG